MTSLSIATTLSCSKEEVITQTSAFTPPGCVIKKVKVITHRFNEATGHEIKHICPIFPKNITRITTKQELMLAVQEEFKSLKERMERGATTISEDLLDFINAIERPDGYWLLTKKKLEAKVVDFIEQRIAEIRVLQEAGSPIPEDLKHLLIFLDGRTAFIETFINEKFDSLQKERTESGMTQLAAFVNETLAPKLGYVDLEAPSVTVSYLSAVGEPRKLIVTVID